ncbi:MAG: NYN domain-containing protein [Desulfovibrio sp.]|nr:NYN domain-containing protein [Desulfovibrio sp.]
MVKLSGFEEVYSALYVDFDNLYARFQEIDPEAARTFCFAPHRWLRWLENHALRILYGEGVRRRILKRMCYMNTQRYQEFRSAFTRSAFQVIDCPAQGAHGKTRVELRVVMDCMDDLCHATHFDEFIILFADMDLTPLVIRLQEHARRTLVLASGHASSQGASASSWRIREDWFLQQALREEKNEETEGAQGSA